jgi:ketosteroid isomerase-like protein
MTTTRLPRPIAAYIAAVNLQDIDAVTASFSEEAVVHDEGQTRRGTGAIRKWAEEVSEKYHPSVEAISAANTGATTIVAVRTAGNFPGSPIELSYTFALDGDKIAWLAIT